MNLKKELVIKYLSAIAHPGITKSRQSRPYEVTNIRKSAFTYISTNIQTGTEPILKAIKSKNIQLKKHLPQVFWDLRKTQQQKNLTNLFIKMT